MLDNLKKYNVMLASKSPRRRELLQQMRIPFHTVSVGNLKEEYPADLPAAEVPEFLANLKADAFQRIMHPGDLIITADTVVILDGKILGKPRDREEARGMLRSLSGRTHTVVTGVAVTTAERRVSFSTHTDVRFAEIPERDIEFYVDNYSPLDKAGAYGIQEWIGCVAVESIEGSYYNVMGLPVHRLYRELLTF